MLTLEKIMTELNANSVNEVVGAGGNCYTSKKTSRKTSKHRTYTSKHHHYYTSKKHRHRHNCY